MSLLNILRTVFEGWADPGLPPGVVRTASGNAAPAPGYEWASALPGEFATRWAPGKLWPERHLIAGRVPGDWAPAPGYEWVSPNDRDSEAVRWVPGKLEPGLDLIAGEQEGVWNPAPGYSWVNPQDSSSLDVRWTPGLANYEAPHVLAADQEGKWRAEPGYRWLNRVPGDLRVKRVPVGENQGNGRRESAESEAPEGDRIQRIKDLAVLGLDEEAGKQDIEAAFRRLVKVHHPDRFSGNGVEAAQAAERAFVLLRSAYERLVRSNGGRS